MVRLNGTIKVLLGDNYSFYFLCAERKEDGWSRKWDPCGTLGRRIKNSEMGLRMHFSLVLNIISESKRIAILRILFPRAHT